MTSEQIAREALTEIAARGVVRADKKTGFRVCPVCRHEQEFQGRCANRDCVTRIAREALDIMRINQSTEEGASAK